MCAEFSMDGWAPSQSALTDSSSSPSSPSSPSSSPSLWLETPSSGSQIHQVALESPETFHVINGPNLTSFYSPPPLFENNPKCQTPKSDTNSNSELYYRHGKHTTVYLFTTASLCWRTSHFSHKIGKRSTTGYDGGSKGEYEEDHQREDAGKSDFMMTVNVLISMLRKWYLKATIVFKLGKSVWPKVSPRNCWLSMAVLWWWRPSQWLSL